MDYANAKLILDNLVLEGENFYEVNLNKKLLNLQPEHLMVLMSFYNIADNRNIISDSGEFTGFTDIKFSEIQSLVGLEERIIEVCYNDLLRDGLIIMTHQQMLYHYITPLGVKLINYVKAFHK